MTQAMNLVLDTALNLREHLLGAADYAAEHNDYDEAVRLEYALDSLDGLLTLVSIVATDD
jgi:hypothetical protein